MRPAEKIKRPPTEAAYFSPAKTKPKVSKLLRRKLRRNVAEGSFELCSEAIHNGDDRDRNASGDEAILNGSRPGFVFKECAEFDHQLSIAGPSKISVN
jgi:hypothetical protein